MATCQLDYGLWTISVLPKIMYGAPVELTVDKYSCMGDGTNYMR